MAARAAQISHLALDLHEPLPFPAGAFDRVVSGLVLEHLRDLDAFFAEARRVLREGGRAVVSAMHPAMFLRGSQARFTDPESGGKLSLSKERVRQLEAQALRKMKKRLETRFGDAASELALAM